MVNHPVDRNINELPDELLQQVFGRLQLASDRNSTALVSRRFYDLERKQRDSIKVGCGLHPVDTALVRLCHRFPSLSKLEVVYSRWTPIFGKQLDDDGLKTIATLCPNLKDLSLSFCAFITDIGLSHLAACQQLQALMLDFNTAITGPGLLSVVAGCKNLSRLHLNRCIHVNNSEWLSFLAHHKQLRELIIRYCRGIGEGDLAKLRESWNRLRVFQFEVDPNYRCRYMNVHGDLARWQSDIFKCEALQELTLSNCLTCPGKGLASILAKCPSLIKLHLNICLGLRDVDVVDLAKTSTGLKSLFLKVPLDCYFYRCMPLYSLAQLTDDSLRAIAKHCHSLEQVSLYFAGAELSCFSLAGILALVEGCASLKALVLEGVEFFNDKGMKALCVARSLRTLELIKCQAVTDSGVKQLMGIPSLKHLKLSRCLGITDAGLDHFRGSRQFESLKVEDCPLISEKGLLGTAKVTSYRQDISWFQL